MSERLYGKISLTEDKKKWVLDKLEPHVIIKLKAMFPSIRKSQSAPFYFDNLNDICADIFWFMQRYKLDISEVDMKHLKRRRKSFYDLNNHIEGLMSPDYKPKPIEFKDGFKARDYQVQGSDILHMVKRILVGDELGLGKTVTAIASMHEKTTLPAIVVCQTHLTNHWKEKIEQFTNLNVEIINGRTPYSLTASDVYIIKYTCLSGWTDALPLVNYKFMVFDEVQELRRSESAKYSAAKELVKYCEYVMGLSATPVYNYGSEIFNIMQVIKEGSLGTQEEFKREWCRYDEKVTDPKALGTYLREKFLFLKRTRAEVGRELPPVNTIVHKVDYDTAMVKESEELARKLALKVMEGSFVERGQAARELDMLARQTTGISKARYVAEYVKFLVDSGEPVVLAGWHRDVYRIWEEEFKNYNPVWYTGTESPAQKEKSKAAFLNGETDIFIISLRSGIGLDGLQSRCKTVVIGELDWSPQIHAQVIGRVDRDGQENQVTAIYLISDTGSDLPIVDLLGIKTSQSDGIINPFGAKPNKVSDESRMKKLAEQYLKAI